MRAVLLALEAKKGLRACSLYGCDGDANVLVSDSWAVRSAVGHHGATQP